MIDIPLLYYKNVYTNFPSNYKKILFKLFR